MKIRYYVLPIILFFLFIHADPLLAKADQAPVVKGQLDLRHIDITEQKVTLDGEWEFYWNELLEPAYFRDLNFHSKTYIQAPSVWQDANYSGGHALDNMGYGTYRLTIIIEDEQIGKPLALYIPSVASAYKLWINGKVLAENGMVGHNRETMRPKSYSKAAAFVSNSNQIELIMQVSNFSQRKGGMWAPIHFGSDQVILKAREKNIIFETVTATALFAIGFYLISLFLFRASSLLPLFLGAFCLLISLRTLLVGEVFLIYIFPNFPWELSVKLEYLTGYFGFMFILPFFYHLYPKEVNRKLVNLSIFIFIFFSFSTLLPAYIYTHFLQAYEICLLLLFGYTIYAVTLATIRKREGSILNFLSIVFLVFAAINDMLYYNQWIESKDLTPTAAAIFLFAQTLIVAKKSSNAFHRVEQLSQELAETNATLEKQVTERTQDLIEKNNQLLHIEKTRKAFYSSVAHEIGTPMQTIQGYIQLIQNNIKPEEHSTYLNIVYDKTRLVNHLSRDLLDLAKMDESQFAFHYEEIEAVFLVEHLYNSIKHDIEKAGLNSAFIPMKNTEDSSLIVHVDVFRLEQVVSNIAQNAIKFTPKGGSITLKGSILTKTNHLVIDISDTGVGIEAEQLPRVFDRFYKGDDRKAEKTGSGLGLAICYEIIKNHQGTLTASSKVGKGSTFTIKIPAKDIRGDNDVFNHFNH